MSSHANKNIGRIARLLAIAAVLLFPLAASAAQDKTLRAPARPPAPAAAPAKPHLNVLREAEAWGVWGENRIKDFSGEVSGIRLDRFLIKPEPHQASGLPGDESAVASAEYYFGDALQSVHQVTNDAGTVVRTQFTDAWGNDIAGVGSGSSGNAGDRYGFTGRENDAESGLMHYRARSYDPMVGRFTSRDPVPYSNLYIYVQNDPVNFRDPLGMYGWNDFWGDVGDYVRQSVDFATGEAKLVVKVVNKAPEAAQEVEYIMRDSVVHMFGLSPFVENKSALWKAGPVGVAKGLAGIPERANEGMKKSVNLAANGELCESGEAFAEGPLTESANVLMLADTAISGIRSIVPSKPAPTVMLPSGVSIAADSAEAKFLGVEENAASRTNGQLVQEIAERADAWGDRMELGKGPKAGTLKHGYAQKLLDRYQSLFGDRGLTTEARYINGAPWQEGVDPVKGSIRLDVVEGPLNDPTCVWDYKFGDAKLTGPRIDQIRKTAGLGSEVPVIEVKP